MGTMTILQQQQLRELEKKNKMLSEIEKIERLQKAKFLEQEEDKKISKNKELLRRALKERFAEQFEKFSPTNKIDEIYNAFLLIDIRESEIQEVGSNAVDYELLDSMYKNALDEVYKKYKDSEKASNYLNLNKTQHYNIPTEIYITSDGRVYDAHTLSDKTRKQELEEEKEKQSILQEKIINITFLYAVFLAIAIVYFYKFKIFGVLVVVGCWLIHIILFYLIYDTKDDRLSSINVEKEEKKKVKQFAFLRLLNAILKG